MSTIITSVANAKGVTLSSTWLVMTPAIADPTPIRMALVKADAAPAMWPTGVMAAVFMTAGAAMAFITAGAVSSIPAAIAVWALVKKPVFLQLGQSLVYQQWIQSIHLMLEWWACMGIMDQMSLPMNVMF